ncbi:hypothetical protein MBAV_001834 [Candidatus Magnetobacterium bavaricum]|uniref:Uncharacterized protein n=1 Tax=Candidatus Magnetobacterium bavaricum TaxID=29290 RepID=A0A0F3GVQ7_9BACT|nr:hypothetical protein MBAV_001834 [Candidatus Magnetobacterium bavaricum]
MAKIKTKLITKLSQSVVCHSVVLAVDREQYLRCLLLRFGLDIHHRQVTDGITFLQERLQRN